MNLKSIYITFLSLAFIAGVFAQNRDFNGLDMNMGNLYRISKAESRSISPENFTGEKGK